MGQPRPLLLGDTFFPAPGENRMELVGDTNTVRDAFLRDRPACLEALFQHRFGWMNEHLVPGSTGLEVGCGAAFTAFFLRTDIQLFHSDVQPRSWIQLCADGLQLPLQTGSLDFVLAVDVLHHFAYPLRFFHEAHRILKPTGRIILKDTHASLGFRAILRLMRHEGYDYNVDPFDDNSPCNDPGDPWSGNNALADLLYAEVDRLENLTGFSTLHHRYCESLMLYLSGGVSSIQRTLSLPYWIYPWLSKLDRGLSAVVPNLFASGVEWVLIKKSGLGGNVSPFSSHSRVSLSPKT